MTRCGRRRGMLDTNASDKRSARLVMQAGGLRWVEAPGDIDPTAPRTMQQHLVGSEIDRESTGPEVGCVISWRHSPMRIGQTGSSPLAGMSRSGCGPRQGNQQSSIKTNPMGGQK